MPLQGSCSLEFNGKILLIGGKNEQNFASGSKQILQFDPADQSWSNIWPQMKLEHYYHGCSLLIHNEQPALAVIGGQGCDCSQSGCSEKVELLILPTEDDWAKASKSLDGIIQWDSLPDTNYSHAFMPAVAYVDGYLYVAGGADYALSISGNICAIWSV